MTDAKFGTHVPAYFYGGGPLDGRTETIELTDGALPHERHCAMPLPPVTVTVPTGSPSDVEPLRVGVYRLNSARSADDPEGFPGDTVWVAANYRWSGER